MKIKTRTILANAAAGVGAIAILSGLAATFNSAADAWVEGIIVGDAAAYSQTQNIVPVQNAGSSAIVMNVFP